jgi:hypothetical protein
MDVLNDQLIDIGLNILGYLIAGALGMLVYSTFRRGDRAPAAVPVEATPTEKNSEPAPDKRSLEFVSFKPTPTAEIGEGTAPAEPSQPKVDRQRRADRAEIVRLAREMIKAGTPETTIKRTLPISEGELALLQIGKQ